MALSLSSLSFPGLHGEFKIGPWQQEFARAKWFGVRGVSEIVGRPGGRELSTELWLFNSYANGAAVRSAIETLNEQIGLNGTLSESGSISSTFANVTFEGFELQLGPLPPSGSVSGYFAIGNLKFFQLSP